MLDIHKKIAPADVGQKTSLTDVCWKNWVDVGQKIVLADVGLKIALPNFDLKITLAEVG